MAAIMLHDPKDAATERAVGELLRKLAEDPANGIAYVADRARISQVGGFPDASFVVVLKPGYYAGSNLSGDIVSDMPAGRGGHGFSPEYADMRASFFVSGRDIARHRNLGIIDMRQIAPSLAQLLGVNLPTADGMPLRLAR